MNIKQYTPIFEIVFLAILTYALHWFLLGFFEKNVSDFSYSLIELYGYFCCFSLLIICILIKVRKRNIDSVGNTFMLLTCIKLFAAYLLLRPILSADHKNLGAEKTNFFIVFALFLAIETMVTTRMLNKKD